MNKELNSKSNLEKAHLGEYERSGAYLRQISDAAKAGEGIP
jgi:hypothetical protein